MDEVALGVEQELLEALERAADSEGGFYRVLADLLPEERARVKIAVLALDAFQVGCT